VGRAANNAGLQGSTGAGPCTIVEGGLVHLLGSPRSSIGCEKGSRPDPAAWRHRHYGQSRLAQGPRRASRHPKPPAPGSSTCQNNSPDLTPIEQFFAKFRHWLRKAAQRTTEAVYEAIAPILGTVSPAECANYFANAGYDQS
jgi:hypothetical protein